jgi:hypothetical protein
MPTPFQKLLSSCALLAALVLVARSRASAAPLIVRDVELQPLVAQMRRLVAAMDYVGEPLDETTRNALDASARGTDAAKATETLQALLDAHCLFVVHISPESRVSVSQGPAAPRLVEQGWRSFLVKVVNEAGVTAPLRVASPNAGSLSGTPMEEIPNRWLDLTLFDKPPMTFALSGLQLEYRIIQLSSRDAGKREATLSFDVGQGTQDLGFRSEVVVLFDCLPAQPITLRVRDSNDEPTTAAFVIRDQLQRVYPSMAKRLNPDLAFQPQIYRADGESVRLPDGTYTVEFSRGPESLTQTSTIVVAGKPQALAFTVKRWIDPAALGYWSGDHHIHAAGCAHYDVPSQGLRPSEVIRHSRGEDLKVGVVLTWGPCFDYQRQFFRKGIQSASEYPYLLRYDVEVSGFGSQFGGHLCLLGLKKPIFPGSHGTDNWPTLGLTTLRWAKRQGAVTGTAHSGFGLAVRGTDLPSYEVPGYDSIGANEYIVDVTHQVKGEDGRPVPAVDFVSLGNTPYVWELNVWYHTLNVGFRPRASGETDFPCIYGERVGLGRSYVKLGDRLDYQAWIEGIRAGRGYVSDGRSHLLDFAVDGHPLGADGSEVKLREPQTVRVTAKIAALLAEQPDPALQALLINQKPFWHLERARVAGTREVPVDVVVNGFPVATKRVVADGTMREIAFDVRIERSSWVAMRILASSHTNPIWVMVGEEPLQPDRRSVEWCLKGVDQCWSQKAQFIKAEERGAAEKAYEHAREVYRALLPDGHD